MFIYLKVALDSISLDRRADVGIHLSDEHFDFSLSSPIKSFDEHCQFSTCRV